MRVEVLCCVATLALGGAACGRSGDDVSSQQAAASQTEGTAIEQAETAAPPPASDESSTDETRQTLPETASPLSLMGVVGLLALGGAAAVRNLRWG
jgi:hypothetical protein